MQLAIIMQLFKEGGGMGARRGGEDGGGRAGGAGSFPQDKMLVFSPAVAGLKKGGGGVPIKCPPTLR